jgi:hypothetical protein
VKKDLKSHVKSKDRMQTLLGRQQGDIIGLTNRGVTCPALVIQEPADGDGGRK